MTRRRSKQEARLGTQTRTTSPPQRYEYDTKTAAIAYSVPLILSEWSIWPFHYDFRFTLGGKQLYIETILQDDDPDDPTIQIVSIHDA